MGLHRSRHAGDVDPGQARGGAGRPFNRHHPNGLPDLTSPPGTSNATPAATCWRCLVAQRTGDEASVLPYELHLSTAPEGAG